ncbi:MAG: hypothetical protein COC15_04980 [Legionellales bacterium]|nr:MAG: hypothetical protein COC15_04980 [Legionellales bacterium]
MDKKYIKYIVILLAALLLGVAGWQYSKYRDDKVLLQASGIYAEMLSAHEQQQDDQVIANAKNLVAEHGTTPYGVIAAMLLAKIAIEGNDFVTATQHLNVAVANGKNNLSHIARLRLARVLLVQEKYAAALEIVADHKSKFFSSLYFSVQGDIYAAMGETKKARAAYNSVANNDLVDLKLSDL